MRFESLAHYVHEENDDDLFNPLRACGAIRDASMDIIAFLVILERVRVFNRCN